MFLLLTLNKSMLAGIFGSFLQFNRKINLFVFSLTGFYIAQFLQEDILEKVLIITVGKNMKEKELYLVEESTEMPAV